MDGVSEPLGEVRVIDAALLAGIVVYHELQEIVVVQLSLVAKVLQDVLYRDVTVVVCVQGQERLSNRVVAVLKFELQLGLQFLQALFDHGLGLFPLGGVRKVVSVLLSYLIIGIICGVLSQVSVREEVLLEGIEVHTSLGVLEQVVLGAIDVNLLLGPWDPVFHHDAVHEDIPLDVAEAREVKGVVCVLSVPVHVLELLP